MTEEEEKAIFWIKGLEDDKEYLTIEQRQAIHTLLNLLSKKDKVIEELERENDELRRLLEE